MVTTSPRKATIILRRLGLLAQAGRRQRGYSQEEFAAQLGISVRSLARLEAGELDPRFGLLLSMERLVPGLMKALCAQRDLLAKAKRQRAR